MIYTDLVSNLQGLVWMQLKHIPFLVKLADLILKIELQINFDG